MLIHICKTCLALAILAVCCVSNAQAQSVKAAYFFQDTLSSSIGGAPALSSVDPLGLSGFETATVFGETRRVYRRDGNASPANQQAGFTLDTTGLLTPNDYSVETVFEFTEMPVGGWRRILNTQDVTSDRGFYVDFLDRLHVTDNSGSTSGPAAWTNNALHHVVLTNGGGTVSVYLDGAFQFTRSTSVMNISNPNDLMAFFLDNTAEYSDGRVASILVFDGVLNGNQVQERFSSPFTVPTAVPEFGTNVLLASCLLLFVGMARRRRR